jgi:hypothetical protein
MHPKLHWKVLQHSANLCKNVEKSRSDLELGANVNANAPFMLLLENAYFRAEEAYTNYIEWRNENGV